MMAASQLIGGLRMDWLIKLIALFSPASVEKLHRRNSKSPKRYIWLDGGAAIPGNRSAAVASDRGFAGALDIRYVDSSESPALAGAAMLPQKREPVYFHGWCPKKQRIRSFRVARIITITDGDTGEIIRHDEIPVWLMRRASL
jgi:hypothetical protein